jgi:Tfp pilus assembly protein PilF
VPGSARGGVFAYAEELSEWLKAPNHVLDFAAVAAENPAAEEDLNQATVADFSEEKISPEGKVPTVVPSPNLALDLQAAAPTHSKLAATKPFLWLVPLALIAGFFLVFSFGHHQPKFKSALAAPHVPSADAQDLYLKGRYYFEKRTSGDLNQAVDFFTQAIVHDPGYAAPYVGLADTYNLLREYSAMPPQEAFPRALAAATKAVELDPNSAEAHNSLAFASFWGFFDAATADREFKRAIELDATLPRAHHWYATFLVNIQRNREALAEIERARQLDPSSTPILADKGFILAYSGKVEEARTLLTQLAASQPEFAPSHRYLAQAIYYPEGNYPGYFDEMGIVAHLRHDQQAEKSIAAEQAAYNKGGQRGLYEERLASAREAFDHGVGSAFSVAAAYGALGQKDDALKYLKIAYKRHDLQLTTITSSEELQFLHHDPEFRELVVKVGLPPVN